MNLLPFDESLAHKPRPGLYRTTFSEYLSIVAMSRSVLFEMVKSPAHCREAMGSPVKFSEALDVGEAVHTLVLEPERAPLSVLVHPDEKMTRRQAGWVAFERETHKQGKVPLTRSEAKTALGVAKRIGGDPFAETLLASPLREVTAIWVDQQTGVPCKARIDLLDLGPVPFMLDLKTTADASERKFAYSCRDYGYTLQAGMYLSGLDEVLGAGRVSGFLVAACEKEPPYRLEWYDMRRHADAGREQFRRLMDLYLECITRDDWPATSRVPGSAPTIRELPLL